MIRLLLVLVLGCLPFVIKAQHSVARQWNEVLLEAIRNDFARPTVHARNLFHISAAMYDSWAIYNDGSTPYFMGNTIHGFPISLESFPIPANKEAAINEALSYAAFRLIHHRFAESPDYDLTAALADSLFYALGHDPSFTSENYQNGNAAALGNYIASSIIAYGLTDGSLEQFDYINVDYFPINPALAPTVPGSQGSVDPNRWQPLAFDTFIDQSGNVFPGQVPEFLSPEWGNVDPFSLQADALTVLEKDGIMWNIYHDPGPPALLLEDDSLSTSAYKWNHLLVALWSAQHDPADNVIWDISPKGIGNLDISDFPSSFEEYKAFYDEYEGGDGSSGRAINPVTNMPYESQLVPRGDYTRVLAEFWADGPDSETPPGHWFTILNYVSDHPMAEKKFKGTGESLPNLEWDVKAYFTLGGAMHDAAISAWSVKGYYDYVRPISAIRYMADKGQSSDPDLPNYHPQGMPLIEGLVESVEAGDPLAGADGQHVGKIKLYTWRGPEYIEDEETDAAGVGWILAENWWPYQRPTFVTPPFAGYVSGHSTFSRAAAEVMTLMTGDEYFPGGMGEFHADKNEFLVFEEGPSVDVVLQWATYRDASDQCSLSRIWGGIHPPIDDIPGRRMGELIGKQAFEYALNYIQGRNQITSIENIAASLRVFPNPSRDKVYVSIPVGESITGISVTDIASKQVKSLDWIGTDNGSIEITLDGLPTSIYLLRTITTKNAYTNKIIIE